MRNNDLSFALIYNIHTRISTCTDPFIQNDSSSESNEINNDAVKIDA